MNAAWVHYAFMPILGIAAGAWLSRGREISGPRALACSLAPAVGLGLAKVIC